MNVDVCFVHSTTPSITARMMSLCANVCKVIGKALCCMQTTSLPAVYILAALHATEPYNIYNLNDIW